MKNITLNLCFEGKVMPDEEYPHPEGALLAKLLKAELGNRSWKVDEIENSRDSGWEIGCLKADSRISISFAKMEENLWFLQIEPTRIPSLFSRMLFKKANSCSPQEVYKLALEVDQIVKSYQGLSGFLWQWGAPPDEKTSGANPLPPG